MEMQFDKIPVAHLQKLTGQLRSQEQTQEVRLPDGMPDIGHVLGSWGQVIVRGKEWNGDHMAVACGVMVWVLYTPEDGEGVRSVDAWLPFSFKWDLPDTRHDGKILISCWLKHVDARSTSARKLMVRANLEALGEAWQPGNGELPVAEELPDDVYLLKNTYPVMLPREAGEKAFVLEEQVTLPTNFPKPEKLMYYSLQPEIAEQKMMAGKLVFRGNGLLHILYRGQDGKLYTYDCDLPFSQYAELEGEYDQDASASLYPCVTSLDVMPGEDGTLQLKAGLLGQYLLSDRTMLTVPEDVYSPYRPVQPATEQLVLPTVLDRTVQTLHGEQTLQADVAQLVDVVFNSAYEQPERTDAGFAMPVSGRFQILYYDPEGMLCSASAPWEEIWELDAAHDSIPDARTYPMGRPQAVTGAGSVTLRADVQTDAVTWAGQGICAVSGMEMGEPVKPDPNRPSLILCRKGNRSLWDVAKATGSTVEKIMQANGLDTEADDNAVLLIPVC
ncbi:MAG: DUF3794 domain-containing protein [Oscillospiraceae bacterium]|nr:DUF3794 domain-containing protein [Oscillospiraceae bacterium]